MSHQDATETAPSEKEGDLDDWGEPDCSSDACRLHGPESFEENLKSRIRRRSIGRFRPILAQILAVTAKNLVLFDLGMTMAFPTVVVPALLDKKLDGSERLQFDESQASWFASIAMLCQPLGSALSGTLSGPLGRKRSLMLVNIPQMVGWLMLYLASSVEVMYAASALQGLGAGLMDAPVFTYAGEICEPSLRGILIAYTLQFCSIGFLLQCFLGSFFHWRTVALISFIFPTVAFICISQIPETPVWLLSKNRVKEAEKALCWLRGWVPKEIVAKEFADLIKHNDNSKYQREPLDQSIPLEETLLDTELEVDSSIESCKKPCIGTSSPDEDELYDRLTFFEKVKDLLRPEIMRPMAIITILNIFYFTSGIQGFRSYMVLVFQRLYVPLDAYWASVWISTSSIVSHLLQMVTVKTCGKRLLTLISTSGAALCCFAIAVQINFQTFFNDLLDKNLAGWLLFSYFVGLTFVVNVGLGPTPWMLMSEIFPFRGRSFASGFCASIYYAMSFVASKTYLSFLADFGITGSNYVYGFVSAIGFIYVYLYLPETEGLTLEEIEVMYKKERRTESFKQSSKENRTELKTV